jgi:hypothetical protein
MKSLKYFKTNLPMIALFVLFYLKNGSNYVRHH